MPGPREARPGRDAQTPVLVGSSDGITQTSFVCLRLSQESEIHIQEFEKITFPM